MRTRGIRRFIPLPFFPSGLRAASSTPNALCRRGGTSDDIARAHIGQPTCDRITPASCHTLPGEDTGARSSKMHTTRKRWRQPAVARIVARLCRSTNETRSQPCSSFPPRCGTGLSTAAAAPGTNHGLSLGYVRPVRQESRDTRKQCVPGRPTDNAPHRLASAAQLPYDATLHLSVPVGRTGARAPMATTS